MFRKFFSAPKRRVQADNVIDAIEGQLKAAIRYGVNDDFQRGYVCALYWTWKSAGCPDTAASIAAEALVTGGIVAD